MLRPLGVSWTISLVLWAPAALSQQPTPCAPLAGFLAAFQKSFGEVPVMTGVGGEGKATVVILASPSGTWSELVVMAKPPHLACLIGDGTGWQAVAAPAHTS